MMDGHKRLSKDQGNSPLGLRLSMDDEIYGGSKLTLLSLTALLSPGNKAWSLGWHCVRERGSNCGCLRCFDLMNWWALNCMRPFRPPTDADSHFNRWAQTKNHRIAFVGRGTPNTLRRDIVCAPTRKLLGQIFAWSDEKTRSEMILFIDKWCQDLWFSSVLYLPWIICAWHVVYIESFDILSDHSANVVPLSKHLCGTHQLRDIAHHSSTPHCLLWISFRPKQFFLHVNCPEIHPLIAPSTAIREQVSYQHTVECFGS